MRRTAGRADLARNAPGIDHAVAARGRRAFGAPPRSPAAGIWSRARQGRRRRRRRCDRRVPVRTRRSVSAPPRLARWAGRSELTGQGSRSPRRGEPMAESRSRSFAACDPPFTIGPRRRPGPPRGLAAPDPAVASPGDDGRPRPHLPAGQAGPTGRPGHRAPECARRAGASSISGSARMLARIRSNGRPPPDRRMAVAVG